MIKRIFVFLASLFIFVTPAFAATSELLPSGQVIDSDYFRTGQTIQIDGEIKGDAFLAGGIVTVNGRVDGDLFIIGGKVNINGSVGNSIRVMAGDVTINSVVDRNVLAICGNCNITKQSSIAGSLLVGGANLEVSAGKIGRGFRFVGNRLFLNSEISNEAFVVADKEFLLGPQASISSDLKYTGSTKAVLESGATVAGNISYQNVSSEEGYPRFFGVREILASYKQVKPLTDVLGFAVSALIGFILLGLFPRLFEKSVMAMENKPAASLGWGLVATLALPLLIILFAITIVGIPVSLVLLFIFYLIWTFSQYLTAFFIGRKIMLPKFGERRGWALVLGLFLITLIGLIPILGNLVKLIVVFFALGSAILAYKQPVIIEHTSPTRRLRSRGKHSNRS